MGPSIYVSVNDTSPSISYSPFRDTFSAANLTAGWNPYFSDSGFITALGEIGKGTSSHATSLDEAALSITWTGIGIELHGSMKAQASYDIILNGTPQQLSGADRESGVLAKILNLTDTMHNISLIARIPANEQPGSSVLYFDYARIQYNVNAPSNATFNLRPLNTSFVGQWTFQNNSNNSFHSSVTKGDIAQATFRGASFSLNGMTSPTAGTYSVVLDNVTSTLSGRSSFKNPGSLLFFATGLDPTKVHNIQVINEDGSDLSLKADGFEAFLAEPPTASSGLSTSPSSGSAATRSKGTTAALVLAGILGFLVMTGFLFFLFVIRPRRRRRRQARMERRRRKEQEAGGLGVLNIAPPEFRDDMELGSRAASPRHRAERSSGKSGFTRWKREMEGGFGSLGLGISFRHSDSTGKRSAGRNNRGSEPPSTKSSRISSKRGYEKGKRKAVPMHFSESSGSPRFAVELPVRPESSADSFKDKDIGPSHLASDEHLSIISGLTSLSYMNTPPAAAKLSPPTYAVSNPNRHSNSNSVSPPQSVPRAMPSPAPNNHSRQGSTGLLLNQEDPIPGATEDPIHNYEHFLSSDSARYLLPLAPRDRGSAQYSSDDATSYLGSAAARLAIRGLSPRTSEFSDPPLSRHPHEYKGKLGPEPMAQTTRSVTRLTPPSNPPASAQHSYARSQSVSFLDFSSSSDASHRTQSIAPSESSTQNRQRQLQSRWSSSMSQETDVTRSSASIPTNSPASGAISYFPYPISLPSSPHHPEGHISSPPSQSQAISQRIEPHLHPASALRLSAFGSPIDIVPMSVTESKSRSSGSTRDSHSTSNSLQLPPHPPLPDTNPAKSPSP